MRGGLGSSLDICTAYQDLSGLQKVYEKYPLVIWGTFTATLFAELALM